MIFDYFKKREEANRKRREDAKSTSSSQSRSHSTYNDTPYVAPNYSTFDSVSTWSDSSSSSSCDSGGGGCD